MICLYLKMRNNSMYLQNRFWLVHIPFGGMVKLQYFAQFPMDHLPHRVVFSLTPLLHEFTIFAYYAINGFVSITI